MTSSGDGSSLCLEEKNETYHPKSGHLENTTEYGGCLDYLDCIAIRNEQGEVKILDRI